MNQVIKFRFSKCGRVFTPMSGGICMVCKKGFCREHLEFLLAFGNNIICKDDTTPIGGVIYGIDTGKNACFEKCMKEKENSKNIEHLVITNGKYFSEVSKNENKKYFALSISE